MLCLTAWDNPSVLDCGILYIKLPFQEEQWHCACISHKSACKGACQDPWGPQTRDEGIWGWGQIVAISILSILSTKLSPRPILHLGTLCYEDLSSMIHVHSQWTTADDISSGVVTSSGYWSKLYNPGIGSLGSQCFGWLIFSVSGRTLWSWQISWRLSPEGSQN